MAVGQVMSAWFDEPCDRRVLPRFERRPGNALNIEIGSPSVRCKDRVPDHWPEGMSSARWLLSGGSPLVLGTCSPGACPRRREHIGTRTRLFADTVVRRVPGEPHVWLMNRQRRGWGESARRYTSIAEIERIYAVQVGAWQADDHGEFAPVRMVKE